MSIRLVAFAIVLRSVNEDFLVANCVTKCRNLLFPALLARQLQRQQRIIFLSFHNLFF